MPRKFTASLRLRDPSGFDRARRDARPNGLRGFGRAIVILVAATIIASAAATPVAAAPRHSSRSQPSQPTGHGFANLKPLWSAYPLRPRRGSSRKRAIPRARPPSSRPSKTSAGGQRSHQQGSWLAWVIAAGVATTVLLVLVARQRRRRLALRKAEHQPSPRLAVGGGGEDGIAPAADWSDHSTRDPPAPRAPIDNRRIAVDWPDDYHLLFVPTSTGYILVARPGDVPPALVEFDGKDFGLDGRFRVSKIGASPLPSDERACAYLERT